MQDIAKKREREKLGKLHKTDENIFFSVHKETKMTFDPSSSKNIYTNTIVHHIQKKEAEKLH